VTQKEARVISTIMTLKKETVHKYRYGEDGDPINQRLGDQYISKRAWGDGPPPRKIMVTAREISE
jgi:hypothetical protein